MSCFSVCIAYIPSQEADAAGLLCLDALPVQATNICFSSVHIDCDDLYIAYVILCLSIITSVTNDTKVNNIKGIYMYYA